MTERPESDDILQELARLPSMAHPTVSPDGNAIAPYYDLSGINEILVFDLEDGGFRQ
jgi:hypothetical protein